VSAQKDLRESGSFWCGFRGRCARVVRACDPIRARSGCIRRFASKCVARAPSACGFANQGVWETHDLRSAKPQAERCSLTTETLGERPHKAVIPRGAVAKIRNVGVQNRPTPRSLGVPRDDKHRGQRARATPCNGMQPHATWCNRFAQCAKRTQLREKGRIPGLRCATPPGRGAGSGTTGAAPSTRQQGAKRAGTNPPRAPKCPRMPGNARDFMNVQNEPNCTGMHRSAPKCTIHSRKCKTNPVQPAQRATRCRRSGNATQDVRITSWAVSGARVRRGACSPRG
jgi:hypothetical protein